METTQTLDPIIEHVQPQKIDEQQAYNFAADQIINQRRPSEEVADMLVQKGLDRTTAYSIEQSMNTQNDDGKKERARKDMIYGGLWFFGGIIVTLVTYSSASGGGSYVVAWGAILFGGIQFFRGVANM